MTRDVTLSCSSTSRATSRPSRRRVAWALLPRTLHRVLFQHTVLPLLLPDEPRPASRRLLLQRAVVVRRGDAVRSALRSGTGGGGFAAPSCACSSCCGCVAQSLPLVLLQHELLAGLLRSRSARPRVLRAPHPPAARAHSSAPTRGWRVGLWLPRVLCGQRRAVASV